MVMFIGTYSCLLWTIFFEFFLDVSQFDLYKRGDRSGIVIGRCHCSYIYVGIIC
jgi:hypothetical protein